MFLARLLNRKKPAIDRGLFHLTELFFRVYHPAGAGGRVMVGRERKTVSTPTGNAVNQFTRAAESSTSGS
jgi:hypothetical protein